MGWSVTIADNRKSYLQAQRFPHAEQLYLIPSSCDISGLQINNDDTVVMMTHNYPQDLLLLPQLLQMDPCYVGMLGPRTRAEKLFAEIGITPHNPNIFAPIGLDIGGDHPQGIALSIAAEIQAVLAERSGGFLRQRMGSIHVPVLECGSSSSYTKKYFDHRILASCDIEHA
jgi:xanthine dehydrogenase accessory factor